MIGQRLIAILMTCTSLVDIMPYIIGMIIIAFIIRGDEDD